jgi:hypothetical protein
MPTKNGSVIAKCSIEANPSKKDVLAKLNMAEELQSQAPCIGLKGA